MMLNILFEDQNVIVIDKPAGLVVHPDTSNSSGTLIEQLIKYCPTIKNAVIDREDPLSRQRPGIVHRLDRDTSGLMILAKNRSSLIKLQEAIKQHKILKIYQALLYGRLVCRQTVETNIVRSKRSDRVMAVGYNPKGRKALSVFIPKQYLKYQKEDITLCDVEIATGRTHQIRVHAAYINHPVLGDRMYGSKLSQKLSTKLSISRQMLHASKISFPHPVTGEYLSFCSPLPCDFNSLISQLKKSQLYHTP